jgi:hypothetical protein
LAAGTAFDLTQARPASLAAASLLLPECCLARHSTDNASLAPSPLNSSLPVLEISGRRTLVFLKMAASSADKPATLARVISCTAWHSMAQHGTAWHSMWREGAAQLGRRAGGHAA